MSRLVRVAKGQWRKSGEGVWRFERDSAVLGHDILVGRNDHVEAVKGMVRGVFRLRAETPLLLTFQLPQWLLEPHGATYPPTKHCNKCGCGDDDLRSWMEYGAKIMRNIRSGGSCYIPVQMQIAIHHRYSKFSGRWCYGGATRGCCFR